VTLFLHCSYLERAENQASPAVGVCLSLHTGLKCSVTALQFLLVGKEEELECTMTSAAQRQNLSRLVVLKLAQEAGDSVSVGCFGCFYWHQKILRVRAG